MGKHIKGPGLKEAEEEGVWQESWGVRGGL